MHGLSGNDFLAGAWDDDTIRGGAGSHTIAVGPGGVDTVVWGKRDALGKDTVKTLEAGTDKLVFHDGFLATDSTRGDDLEDMFKVLQAKDADDSILRANTTEAGWQTIATFDNVSAANLASVIANDTSILVHEVMFALG
ncbi:MAG: hypothetical protein AAFY56_10845 [Pseudomonadota bacterium]